MITLDLSYPPSVNQYWRHLAKGPLAGRVLISQAGRDYRSTVAWECAGQRHHLTTRLAVCVTLHQPDNRRHDLDNRLKALLDALAHAGVYEDDSQIDDIHIVRGEVVKGGKVVVEITDLGVAVEQLPLFVPNAPLVESLAVNPPF